MYYGVYARCVTARICARLRLFLQFRRHLRACACKYVFVRVWNDCTCGFVGAVEARPGPAV